MPRDDNWYFINDTGKTVQELLNEAKARWDSNYPDTNPFQTTKSGTGVFTPIIYFEDVNHDWGWLTDSQIMELNPDELIFNRDSKKTVKLKTIVAYKEAKKRFEAEVSGKDAIQKLLASDEANVSKAEEITSEDSDESGKFPAHIFKDWDA